MESQQSRRTSLERTERRTASRWSGIRRAAVLLCLIPAAYLLVTAIYALLHAGDFASDLPRQLRYVVGPLVITFALGIAAFRLPRDAALTVGIVASSILATLFMFETFLTLRLLPSQVSLMGKVESGVGLEPFQKNLPPAYTIKALNVEMGVTDLNEARLSAVPDQPLMLCSLNGQPVTYRTDDYGFRNPPGGPGGETEIMVLGDSFAEGMCLPEGQGMVGQLRGHAGGPVVNTASRGAGPLFELAVLGRYGPVFRPKVTLMAFFEGNDWENLRYEAGINWLAEALDPATDFGTPGWTEADRMAAQPIIARWWAGSAASVGELFLRRSMLRNYLALQNTALVLGLHYPKAMPPDPNYVPVLSRAAEITESWGGRMVLVYIPAHNRFAGLIPHGFVNEDLRQMVRQAASETGVAVIDLTETFLRHPDPKSLYAADSHFSQAGAALAAEEISARLADPGSS